MLNAKQNMRMKNIVIRVNSIFLLFCGLLLCLGCSGTKQEFLTSSLSSRFPTIQGEKLSGESVTLPDYYLGKPILLLVGYEQESQFDIDRWMLALLQLKVNITVIEVPTIESLGARLAKSFINEGMRRGIPQEDWGAVVTVYNDAAKIREFLGNEGGRNAHVALLDSEGKLRWFHNRGFSPAQALQIIEMIKNL
jgi:hypothetical protein